MPRKEPSLGETPDRSRAAGTRSATRAPTAHSVWILVLGGCTVMVLLSSAGEYARALLREEAVGYFDVVKYQAIDWYLWALAAPLIFRLGRRVRAERTGWPQAVAFHIVVGAAVASLHTLLYVLGAQALAGVLTVEQFRSAVPLALPSHLHIDFLVYLVILGVGHAVDYYALSRERELQASRLETRLAHAQLDALRSQLQPHFLFNTLNAVTALVRRQRNGEAVDMLAGLGDLLRETLDSRKHETSLDRELELLARYLAIQRARFGDRLAIEVDIPEEVRDAAVPGLVLQPLVENAIRHGVERSERPVAIMVRVHRTGDRLVLEVRDDGPGIRPGARDGVGLGNTRERLSQLYGGAHRFEIRNADDGGAVVRIELPYRRIAVDGDATSRERPDRLDARAPDADTALPASADRDVADGTPAEQRVTHDR